MLGWHFCREDKKLGFGDGRQIIKGQTLKVEPPTILCRRGLHASRRIIDALTYAQGPIICRVKLTGDIKRGKNKYVATERTVLQMVDATKLLHEFACRCAERALKKTKVKDRRCWNAIKTKRLWLVGKATDKELEVARNAARVAKIDAIGKTAAWNAAKAAVWAALPDVMEAITSRDDARRAAGWTAAWNATKWDATWSATNHTTWAIAWDAAVTTENAWQSKVLNKMVVGYLSIANRDAFLGLMIEAATKTQ